jgi:putative hemolysin
MSREEVKRAFEDVRFQTHSSESDKVNTLINNIFSLGAKRVKDHMIPLNQMIILSSRATTAEYKELLQQFYSPFCFLYHERPSNIIAVIYPRDLLRQPENKPLVDIAHSPWFVTEQANILQIMKQFRYNKQLAAVILNNTGQSVGIMALDQVSDFIFSHDFPDEEQEEPISYIEKTLDGEMLIEDFNKQFNTHLHYEGVKTLSDFIEVILHHHPSQGDVVRIDRFEMTILEVSLKGIKSLSVKTLH